MAARFFVRLNDPYQSRLLYMNEVKKLVTNPDQAVADRFPGAGCAAGALRGVARPARF